MYILVRKDLPPNKRMTQVLYCLGHFIISSGLKVMDQIIILEVDSCLELLYYNDLIASKGIKIYVYKDEDEQITAGIVEITEASKKVLQRLPKA
jgi:hypothetical protein